MDHCVHGAITNGLRQRGVDVLTSHDDGTAAWDDDKLLDRATALGRTLFSQDDDLLAITYQWLRAEREFAGPVYAHQLNITIGQAVSNLELIAQAMNPEDMRNRIEFIPY
jgi:hypothetical protein